MDDAELVHRLRVVVLRVLADDYEAESDANARANIARCEEWVREAASRLESLSAVKARVEALCDEAPEWTTGVFGITKAVSEADLRAALAERGVKE